MKPPITKRLFSNTESAIPNEPWWACDDIDAHSALVALVHTIEQNQRSQKHQDLRHGYLYQNRHNHDPISGQSRNLPDKFQSTYNVVKSAIDTLTAKIAQNRPRPRILTTKGDYAQQTKAKRLTSYIDGVLASAETYRQGTAAFKDGGIFGTGVIKVIPDVARAKICTERVLITEIFVDELEASYGNPQSLYQVKLVSKDLLLQQFPEHKELINAANPDTAIAQQQHTLDMVRCYEGWHLPDANKEGGKHIMALENGTLFSEEWKFDIFPFAFFRYNTNISSFYGQGIAEELLGTQLEINKILRDIQRAQNLIAVPRVLMEHNSKIVAAHLNNGIGSAIKYTGTRPTFINPTAMNNEIYTHVRWLIQSAFEKVGVSQLSTSSKKPAGLDSGRALREFSNIESERFSIVTKSYEEFFEDITKLTILFSKELYKHDKKLKITTESKKFIESIPWSDVDMEDDKFVSRVYSSSIFPTSPAAKLQKVEEYVRAGWIDKESAIRLLDFPDVEAWETLETADRNYTEHIIGDILGKGKYTPPEPEMLLEKDINIARKAYLEGRDTGAPEEHLELLLRWIEAAASLIPAAPQPPVTEQPLQPQGQALPLPDAGLIPQV